MWYGKPGLVHQWSYPHFESDAYYASPPHYYYLTGQSYSNDFNYAMAPSGYPNYSYARPPWRRRWAGRRARGFVRGRRKRPRMYRGRFVAAGRRSGSFSNRRSMGGHQDSLFGLDYVHSRILLIAGIVLIAAMAMGAPGTLAANPIGPSTAVAPPQRPAAAPRPPPEVINLPTLPNIVVMPGRPGPDPGGITTQNAESFNPGFSEESTEVGVGQPWPPNQPQIEQPSFGPYGMRPPFHGIPGLVNMDIVIEQFEPQQPQEEEAIYHPDNFTPINGRPQRPWLVNDIGGPPQIPNTPSNEGVTSNNNPNIPQIEQLPSNNRPNLPLDEESPSSQNPNLPQIEQPIMNNSPNKPQLEQAIQGAPTLPQMEPSSLPKPWTSKPSFPNGMIDPEIANQINPNVPQLEDPIPLNVMTSMDDASLLSVGARPLAVDYKPWSPVKVRKPLRQASIPQDVYDRSQEVPVWDSSHSYSQESSLNKYNLKPIWGPQYNKKWRPSHRGAEVKNSISRKPIKRKNYSVTVVNKVLKKEKHHHRIASVGTDHQQKGSHSRHGLVPMSQNHVSYHTRFDIPK